MSLAFCVARAVGSLSAWGLKNIFRRPAANFPGKIALYLDPHLIADLKSKIKSGSVVVVGTNGKTTVTNLLADVLEQAGQRVVCNRTGANLDSGVATALLRAQSSDWGVFEADELWLAKILPDLQADYVLLLNLFQDQLDRVGEIEYIQKSIISALETSPRTTLIYNADDPLCALIAQNVKNKSVAFGTMKGMDLSEVTVSDTFLCQGCSSSLEYMFRQYGQLGSYCCPTCGFARPSLDFVVDKVSLETKEISFRLDRVHSNSIGENERFLIHAFMSGAYMVYNLAAVSVAANLLHCSQTAVQKAIDTFNPQNGRLQSYRIGERFVLLNLAKNPTGFNQNIEIVLQDKGPKVVAFFVNDKEGDGRDVSWLWDVGFEALARETNIWVYAGGIRRNDVQVRLKYAGLNARLVDGVADVFTYLNDVPLTAHVYLIANYTALPSVHADMSRLKEISALPDEQVFEDEYAKEGKSENSDKQNSSKQKAEIITSAIITSTESEQVYSCVGSHSIVIAHLLPDLLNSYGDGGNIRVLAHRLQTRGIPVEINEICHEDQVDFTTVDLVFFGGGTDRQQRCALDDLMVMKDDLHAYISRGGVLFAVGNGYSLLGNTCLLEETITAGLGIVDMDIECLTTPQSRLVGDVALRSPLASLPIVGYENHKGYMRLADNEDALGKVIAATYRNNDDEIQQVGICRQNVIGTHLHGVVLAKNPEVADALLSRVLEYHAKRCGDAVLMLSALDDTVEVAANRYMCKKLGISV